ncbi:hypothetical protein NEOLEDRAFT_1115860 [Neolentinus lepideus HHB14362 ss-1]|uniref:Signal recognition particle subunit SRP68 n=1 Tax=Neolentinus lepideus HHB14362 ss-1 TaxID=1314782 RepID=A0A165S562_9AGAM|nr:hypothetical protein NEOLEDRAFT_1115860 [Neolentinus lepideus HHB14362 ss-1]
MASTAQKPVVSFRALQVANEQRSAYGLRYNDFQRYRKHCANRTHRLRSSLKMTHGKGREFKKLPPLTSDNTKDGHLQLLLFEAERAWAYSQELLNECTKPENSSNASNLRHSATGRFRRAVHWSTELLSHCQSLHSSGQLSAENLLEASIYTLILNGRFLRYRDELDDAFIQLSVARSLLDELASRAATSRDQALATVFADDIGPEIRYCAHELGRSNSYDVDAIVRELGPKHRVELVEGCEGLIAKLESETEAAGKGRLRDIVWEGTPVPIRSPELVDVLLRVQEGEMKLSEGEKESQSLKKEPKPESGKRRKLAKGSKSKRGVAAYDVILLALSDAEEVARKLVEAQQLNGLNASTAVAGTRDVHFIHAYIVYQLLSRRIQRDLLLISALLSSHSHFQHSEQRRAGAGSSKPQKEQVDARLYPAVVKVLDTVLQSLDQMRTLSIVDESPDLATAVEARTLFTKARRCLFLSRSYSAVKKYAESLTLIQHAQIHMRETRSLLSTAGSDPISSGSSPFFPLSHDALGNLDAELVADGLRSKKAWFAFNGGQINPESSKTHKKPLFFDIALNYAQLDMDRLQERAGKKPAAPAVKASSAIPLEKKASNRVEETERASTPEPQAAPSRGGLSSLLGGWWGRS